MLDKICETCNTQFTLPKAGKKEQRRRFCGRTCANQWSANNRSDTWRKKASEAKQGENNPMYGVAQTNPNSLNNLSRDYWEGKTHSKESNEKRSEALTGIKRSDETKRKISIANTKWLPDDPQYNEFKKYRRKVYYWTEKNDLTQLENHEKRGRTNYHLDHKYSITEGFKNNVPPKVIGHIANLEFLPHKVNESKGTKCSVTLEKLYGLQ